MIFQLITKCNRLDKSIKMILCIDTKVKCKGVNNILKDFEMIVKKFPKNDDITIYPISDVHLGAAEYMANEWQAFCKKVLDKGALYRL